MAIELNVAQVVGFSVQALLILALIVALSIRSWPFLIAIVAMGLVALTLACVRSTKTLPSSSTTLEHTNTTREIDDEPEFIRPDPPLHIESLEHIRPVRLSREETYPQPHYLAQKEKELRQRAMQLETEKKWLLRQQMYATNLNNASMNSQISTNMPSRQYVSAGYEQALHTTPRNLEDRHRAFRWQHQTQMALAGNGPPPAARLEMRKMFRNDWEKPDPNLVPVTNQPRSRWQALSQRNTSAWSTGSYLHKQ